ncbi:MAG: hypothetical protein Q9169_007873 [Polycauliona sp. 2 TL-2023]
MPVHNDLYRRQDRASSEESSEETSTTTADRRLRFSSTSTAKPAAATFTSAVLPNSSSSPSTSSSTSTPAESTSIVTAPGTGSDLPRPFDTGLGNNYTSDTCPQFINSFLRNETFTSCLPFSLLLQNSMSFFSVTKSLSTITRTLDATCLPPSKAASCTPLMSSLASQLRSDSNCNQDYRREQPLVIAAYNGLVAYEPLYKAGCARDPVRGNYCFANAITNSSSPQDSYPYYLPLGIALPGGSQPSCTACLSETMRFFNEAASEGGDKEQGVLRKTLPAAAHLINLGCGPGFANETVASAGENAGFVAKAVPRWSAVFVLMVLCVTVLGAT